MNAGLDILMRGFLIGLAIAAPVGPIGILCIRKTMENGIPAGLVTGLGAAVADAVYGSIAAFGLTALSTFLVGHTLEFRLFGGLFLIVIGLRTLRSVPAKETRTADPGGTVAGFLTALALTLTNPMTILGFIAIFAGFGVADDLDPSDATILVLGVFLGSAAWWSILSGGVSRLRGRLGPWLPRAINRGSGVMLIGFGVFSLASIATGMGG